jgi:UDP:flavonoid glycosyltransferase YjiC (YdhE family)
MPRVLFFPWGYGGGAGYTARCLSLAVTLRQHGWDAAFAGCGANNLVETAGLPLLPQRIAPDVEHRRVPPYLPFVNVERVWAVAARYYRADRFDEQLAEDERLIRDYRPAVVVIDMTPTAAIAARKHHVPLVSLADADFLSPLPNAWMPWCELDPGQVLPFPSAGDVVLDRARRIAGLDVERPNDVLWGDVSMIPSTRSLDPLPVGTRERGPVRWIGPLSWDPPAAEFRLPDGPGPNIYVTIGSGGIVGAPALQAILDACDGQPWNVFVSAGYGFSASLRVPPNVTMAGFTGIRRCISWADVVISHGGYSTVMQTLRQGRPSVIVPFMSEQEMNGRQLVDATGSGLLLRRSRIDPVTHRITFTDRSSGETESSFVQAVDVRAAVNDVLATPAMRNRAAELGAELEEAARRTSLPALVKGVLGAGRTMERRRPVP